MFRENGNFCHGKSGKVIEFKSELFVGTLAHALRCFLTAVHPHSFGNGLCSGTLGLDETISNLFSCRNCHLSVLLATGTLMKCAIENTLPPDNCPLYFNVSNKE